MLGKFIFEFWKPKTKVIILDSHMIPIKILPNVFERRQTSTIEYRFLLIIEHISFFNKTKGWGGGDKTQLFSLTPSPFLSATDVVKEIYYPPL